MHSIHFTHAAAHTISDPDQSSLRGRTVFNPSEIKDTRVFQAVVVGCFWMVGEGLARLTGIPVPGSVIGLFIVLGLFFTGVVNAERLRRGAEWYIAEMLLFFIPAVLAVMDHHEFLGMLGIKLLAVILAGTVIVMITTAMAVEIALRLSIREGEEP